MSAMKEHGILFSSAMVRAILAGQKTQTRRAVKFPDGAEYDGHRPDGSEVRCSRPNESTGERVIKAPHGPVGRRLYVKETWATSIACDKRKAKDLKHEGWPIWYRADNKVRFLGADTGGPAFMTRGKWRPSIFMPPWASRITLDVTRVRVERVGDLSEEDARAEGVEPNADLPPGYIDGLGVDITTSRGAFAHLWEKINGRGSWAANPYVWVYDLRRVA